MDRAMLRAYFEANPREWAKVAPIDPHTVSLIEKIADNRAYSDARLLDFHSRKDAREQVCEADCMKDVLRLFRSDTEHERIQAAMRSSPVYRTDQPDILAGARSASAQDEKEGA